MEEAQQVVMMFSKALSTLLRKKRGYPQVDLGDISSYQTFD